MDRVPNPFGDDIVLRSIDWIENLPWRQESGLIHDKDKYEVSTNVKGFTPSEIKVKVADGFIVIEASHEEKHDDYGYIARSLIRRYALPDDCLQDRVESKLSGNGILSVSAPRKALVKDNTVIPVTVEGSSVRSKL